MSENSKIAVWRREIEIKIEDLEQANAEKDAMIKAWKKAALRGLLGLTAFFGAFYGKAKGLW